MNQITKDDTQSMTTDIVKTNIEHLKRLFPDVFTEDRIDFEALQSILGEYVEKSDERYSFNWKGKSNARRIAQTPTTATLRPAKQESKNWDTTKNLYIEGDNFEVLRLLQKSYHNKIDVIYVDPPYNTGKDLLYKNDFSENLTNYLEFTKQVNDEGRLLSTNSESSGRYHSDWLSMIYSRLLLARNLLNEKGIICITIDDYELPRLWLVMNEVFGEENHLGTIVIRNNPAGRSTTKGVSITHEYALFYGKTNESQVCRLPRNQKQLDRYKESDEIGSFEWVNFRKPGSLREESPKMFYPIIVEDDNIRVPQIKWSDTEQRWDILESIENKTIIYPIDDEGKERRWRWAIDRFNSEIHDLKPQVVKDKVHIYMKGRMTNDGVLPMTWWDKKEYSSTAYGTNYLKEIFGELQIFSYPKSVYAVKDSLQVMSDKKSAIVLDFFSGSATTAEAVMQLNATDGGDRRFVMVQLPETTDKNKLGFNTICDIGRERIRRAGDKIVKELKEKQLTQKLLSDEVQVNPDDLDIGFKVFKLDTSNIKTWDSSTENIEQTLLDSVSNIKAERSQEDVLYEVLLKYGLDLTLPIEKFEKNGKKLYSVGFGALIVCLDDNIDISVAEKIVEIKESKKPETMNVIFKDNGFKDDVVKTNTIQLLTKHGVESIRSI